MKKLTYSIFIAMILVLIASPVLADKRALDDTRHLRQAAIVDAQHNVGAATGWRVFVVETMATGNYTAHFQANGQSAGYDLRITEHVLAWLPKDRGGVSVSVVGNAATCRIFDSAGRLLSEVQGGNTAFCSVIP